MTLSDNARGGLLMTLSMAVFAIADACIKASSSYIDQGLILLCLGLGSTVIFAALAIGRGVPIFSRTLLAWPVVGRCGIEIVATGAIVMAVSRADLSTVSAIQQTAPLIVVGGAAIFFHETIGWRRITALVLGMTGMLLILRPSTDAFDPNLLFAVVAALGFGARDLLTRAVPDTVNSLQLSLWGSISLMPAGAILMLLGTQGMAWDHRATLPMLLAILSGTLAYYAITAVMRIGEISAVAPLRYTRLVFAAALGILIFGERPDFLTCLGAALVVGSGIYALFRSRP